MTRIVCSFIYDGAAVGKGRPKFRATAKFVQTYTPKKTVAFETAVGIYAQQAVREQGPMATDEPVELSITVYRAPLKSWSAKKRELMKGRRVTGKPDVDNIAKAIADALNGVAYLDDAQISDLRFSRRWGIADEIVVLVSAHDAEEVL